MRTSRVRMSSVCAVVLLGAVTASCAKVSNSESPMRTDAVVAAGASVATCDPANLRISLVTFQAYTLHLLEVYGLENVGTSACSLEGYPAVTAATDSGQDVPLTVDQVTDSPLFSGVSVTEVKLQPGDVAGLWVGELGPTSGPGCHGEPYVRLSITPPGGGAPLVVPNRAVFCAKVPLYVSPVLASPSLPGATGPSGTSGASGTSGSPSTPAVPPCAAADLRLSLVSTLRDASHTIDVWGLENAGSAACSLEGFPGVTFTDASGARLSVIVKNGPQIRGFWTTSVASVVLQPGGVAGLYVGEPTGSGVPSCRANVSIKVSLPADGGVVSSAETTLPLCALVFVSPLQTSPTKPSPPPS